jgi:hypothetical protein
MKNERGGAQDERSFWSYCGGTSLPALGGGSGTEPFDMLWMMATMAGADTFRSASERTRFLWSCESRVLLARDAEVVGVGNEGYPVSLA